MESPRREVEQRLIRLGLYEVNVGLSETEENVVGIQARLGGKGAKVEGRFVATLALEVLRLINEKAGLPPEEVWRRLEFCKLADGLKAEDWSAPTEKPPKPPCEMTVEDVNEKLVKIREAAAQGDHEAACGRENELFLSVVEAIADGAEEPELLAKEAMRSISIEFNRGW